MAKKKSARPTKKSARPAKKSARPDANRGQDAAVAAALNSVSGSLWNDARAGVNTDLQEGDYVGKVVSASVGQKGGVPWFRTQFVITRGEDKGAQVTDFQRFTNDVGIRVLLSNLGNMDVEIEGITPDHLPFVASKLSTEDNPELKLRVKVTPGERGVFTNVYVDGLAD